jgi:hypothetical protein
MPTSLNVTEYVHCLPCYSTGQRTVLRITTFSYLPCLCMFIPIRGFDSQQGQPLFLFFKTFRHAVGPTYPRFRRYQVSSPRVKLPKRKVYHLHLVPRSRMGGALPLLPQCVFMSWTGTVTFVSLLAITLVSLLCEHTVDPR